MELKDKKILVIDDEPLIRRALTGKLHDVGFQVIDAKDGEEGLARALDEHPDLILLDILMPKMDGVTVMKKLREDDWGKNVPIIILTVFGVDDRMLREIMEGRPHFYLEKKDELRLEDIERKVREALGEPKAD